MDIKIVISSSWRVGSIASDWRKLFLHYFNNAEIVIGRTPYLYKDRGIEILELIEIAKEKGHMIDDYIVLDDDIEDIINHISPNKVIKINRKYGLTERDVKQILKKIKIKYTNEQEKRGYENSFFF